MIKLVIFFGHIRYISLNSGLFFVLLMFPTCSLLIPVRTLVLGKLYGMHVFESFRYYCVV